MHLHNHIVQLTFIADIVLWVIFVFLFNTKGTYFVHPLTCDNALQPVILYSLCMKLSLLLSRHNSSQAVIRNNIIPFCLLDSDLSALCLISGVILIKSLI